MPYEEPEADDPMELVGMAIPSETLDDVREMAACIAEEFARLGEDQPAILALFEDPFFASAHRARELLGRDAVERIVEEAIAPWRALKTAVVDAPGGARAAAHAARAADETRLWEV